MTKAILLLTAFAGLAVWCQQPTRPPDGALAAHAVGRVAFHSDGTVELYGYFSVIDGSAEPMFAGAASERNARFTFRSERNGMDYVQNGSLMHLFALPRAAGPTVIRFYRDAEPDQDFDRPESFGNGQLVATYESRGVRVTVIPSSLWSGAAQLVRQSQASEAGFSVPERLTLHLSGLSLASFDDFQLSRSAGGLKIPFGASLYAGGSR